MRSISFESAECRTQGGIEALRARWQALEGDAAGGFFRSWVFLGCQAQQRFAGASLLCVQVDGADVALGLFGRTRGRAWLHQTGDWAADAVFIEHNGLLVRRGHAGVVAPALRAVVRRAGCVVLAGIDEATLAAARAAGWVELQQTRFAPHVALGAPGAHLAGLSANARAQIRRSQRIYGDGLALARARDLAEALRFFEEMVGLHQVGWQRRGKPGAFGDAGMRDFHRTLIGRGFARGEVDLLRVTAGDRVIGVLYNFVRQGRVYCYQSGFGAVADAKEKPGLVSHSLAIEHYAARGLQIYDFLGGDDRYKRTLANGGENLHWAILYRAFSVRGVWRLVRGWARRLRG